MLKQSDIIAVSLDAASWNAALAILAEGSYKLAAPIIHGIQQQCLAYEEGQRGPREVPQAAAE